MKGWKPSSSCRLQIYFSNQTFHKLSILETIRRNERKGENSIFEQQGNKAINPPNSTTILSSQLNFSNSQHYHYQLITLKLAPPR